MSNNVDNTSKIEEIAARESKPRLSHLVKFWLFAFRTTRFLGVFYLSAVILLAALRPALAWAWSGYVSRLEALGTGAELLGAALLLSCFFLISFLSNLIERYTESDNTIECLDIVYANRMREFTQTKMFGKLAEIPVELLEVPKTNDKIKRLFDGVADPYFGLGSAVMRRGYILAGKAVAVVATALALYIVNPFLVLIAALAPIPALISGFVANNRNFALEKETTEIKRKMDYFQDLMTGQGAKELYVFGGHDFIFSRWKKLAEEFAVKEKKARLKNSFAQLLAIFITGLANVSGYIFAIALMAQGMIGLGALAAALQLTNALLRDVSMFFSNAVEVAGKKNEAALYSDFSKLPSTAQDAPNGATIESVEFKGVSYRYPGTDAYVLQDVNISIKKGEKIALVGENGAGKSTFVKLLSGQLSPSKGTVEINGRASGGAPLSHLGAVSQSPA
ncbi:MAG: ABC transporter ATP-binding protein/permease, partial [Treponema sp.]|nr:ABC transporter ATP-binding protein/permease [Treponema sp.]